MRLEGDDEDGQIVGGEVSACEKRKVSEESKLTRDTDSLQRVIQQPPARLLRVRLGDVGNEVDRLLILADIPEL